MTSGPLDLFWLLLFQLSPWALGTLVVSRLVPLTGAGSRAMHLGLGGATGMPLAALALWLSDRLGFALTGGVALTALMLIGAVLIAMMWGIHRLVRPAPLLARPDPTAIEADNRRLWQLLAGMLLLLVCLRLVSLLPDLLLRPVFPWDAWKHWAWKARVWFEQGQLVPFLHPSQWLTASSDQFVIDGVDHPELVPLLMLWSAVGLGMWDDSLVGLAWLVAALSCGLMIHGLLRQLGLPVVMACLGVYLFFSAPMVSTHIALFGYADLWVMLYFVVFAVGLVFWTRLHSWWPVALMVLGALLMALSKDTGVYWLPVLVLAWLATALSSRVLIAAAAAAAIGGAAILLIGVDPLAWLTSGRYTLDVQEPLAVMQGMGRHMFVWLDWHLFWYLVPVALVLAVLKSGAMPELRALFVLSALAVATLVGGFLVTRAGEYAIQGTLFSRVVLQIYPVLVLAGVLALWRWIREQHTQGVGGVTAARWIAMLLLPAVLLWAAWTGLVLYGDNYQRLMPGIELAPDEDDWRMLNGAGALDDRGYRMQASDHPARSLVLAVRLPWVIDAESVETIVLEFEPDASYRRLSMGWGTSEAMDPSRMAPVDMISDSEGRVELDWASHWSGEVGMLTLELTGTLSDPLVVRSIKLLPARPGFLALQQRLIREWFVAAPWTQRSAHRTQVSLQPEIASPLVAVTIWLLLVIGFLIAVPRLRAGRPLAMAVVIPIAVGWLFLDIRWQSDLATRAFDAVNSLAGKNWQERRSAELDGELFDFVVDLKQEVEFESPRVFALGYGEFWRLRARYHAVPWSVRTTDRRLEHEWTRHLRAGDLILLLDVPHVDRTALPERDVTSVLPTWQEFELSQVAGQGARLVEAGGRDVLILEADGAELVHLEFPAPPVSAVQLARVRLAATANAVEARAQVRKRDGEGRWMTLFDRRLSVDGPDFEEHRLVFPVTEGTSYEVRISARHGDGLVADSVTIEPLADEKLLYLQSDAQGPALVVRPLLQHPIAEAYEVL